MHPVTFRNCARMGSIRLTYLWRRHASLAETRDSWKFTWIVSTAPIQSGSACRTQVSNHPRLESFHPPPAAHCLATCNLESAINSETAEKDCQLGQRSNLVNLPARVHGAALR